MIRRAPLLALLIGGCASAPVAYEPPQRMIVSVPVTDVRSKPKPHIGMYVQDPDQETQLLMGEPVLVRERRGKWARVECPLQPEFTHSNAWEGYPGWVLASHLTRDPSKEVAVIPSTETIDEQRQRVLSNAARHIGSPYLWGGRSHHSEEYRKTVTGVDCSGLVNLSFREIGRIVPRDAHEQHMKARRVEPAQLKPGDLLFLAKADKPDRIVHVAFYVGDGRILEAPQSGNAVREISFSDRFGQSMDGVTNGSTVGDRVIYFGTLFEGQ